MTVFVPSDANECHQCVEAAAEINGPVYIRTARLATPVYDPRPFTAGKGTVIRDGSDCVIFTCGIMLEHTMEAAEILESKGIKTALVSFHTIKPFDEALACTYAAKCKKVFTVEEHSILGGLGDTVASAIIGKGVEKFKKIGINDEFGQSGKPVDLLKEYGLTGPQSAPLSPTHPCFCNSPLPATKGRKGAFILYKRVFRNVLGIYCKSYCRNRVFLTNNEKPGGKAKTKRN